MMLRSTTTADFVQFCRGKRLVLAATVLSAATAWAGCSASGPDAPSGNASVSATSHPSATAKTAPAAGGARSPMQVEQVEIASAPAPREPLSDAWFSLFIEGKKIGYGKTVTTRVADHGQELRAVVDEVHLSLGRNGQTSEQRIVSTGVETPAGQLLRFRTKIDSGAAPIVTIGEVRDGDMCFQTLSTGSVKRSFITWQSGVGGFLASEESLAARPMQPGEHRRLKGLMVGFNEVAVIDMTAGAYESTAMLDGSAELLRIRWTATLGKGDVVAANWWADRGGQVMKTELDALHQTTFRTTEEIALAQTDTGRFDLLLSTTVPASGRLPLLEETRRVLYRVHLESGDPSHVFFSGVGQRVRPIDGHTAEIEVLAVRPQDSKSTNPPLDPATPKPPGRNSIDDASIHDASIHEASAANNLVQSDDPRIIALARQAAGAQTDPWRTALALEKFTHDYITGRNYADAFATASEVAESRTGACTQHAVLLAALARARGIPARVAIGLVYTPSNSGFAFHMWNEVWIADQWIPLDATRGQGGVGADRLKLTDSNLAGENAYSCFLPVAEVIGQAKIEVLEAE